MLDEKFSWDRLAAIDETRRRLCPETNKAGACGAGFAGFDRKRALVANGDAGNIGALQRLADRFGLIALEAGEAGAEELAIILGNDRLGEWIGLAQQAAG